MQAFRVLGPDRPAELVEVAEPRPGPGQAVVAVASAGLCRTDLNILDSPAGYWPDPPFTLGHEIAGVIESVGSGVRGVRAGEPVLVSAVHFCGSCARCRRGRDHECLQMGHVGYGVGLDGGLARRVVADAIHLVPLGDLDPRGAAPLGDAAATAYHAVQKAADVLWPDATAVVLGVGGLGDYAVQFLNRLTGANVMAVDRVPERLAEARRRGVAATHVFDDDTAAVLREWGRGRVDVVLDFVGSTETVTAALGAVGVGSRLIVAGIGGADVSLGWERMPRNSSFENSRGYSRADLADVVALAAAGHIDVPQTHYGLDRVEEALADLRAARVSGRAVVLPNG